MKAYISKLLFALLIAGLSLTAYSATTYADPGCAPGCDCTSGGGGGGGGGGPGGGGPGNTAGGVLGEMQRHADAMRVRDKAIAQQIYKQPDNALGMTCYDQALGLSARLGQIFSDVLPQNLSTPNGDVFTGIKYAQLGLDGKAPFLGTALSNTISPGLKSHLDNFIGTALSSGSISQALGATAAGFIGNYANQLQDLLNTTGVLKYMGDVQGVLNTVNSIYSTVRTALDLLGYAVPTEATAILATINGVMKTIETTEGQAVKDALQLALKALQPIINKIMGIGPGNASPMGANAPCNRMAQLWGGATTPTGTPPGFTSAITGSGMTKGVPYTTLSSLLTNQLPAGAGADFTQALTIEQKSGGTLSNALADITGNGGLAKPGNMPSWATTPVIPKNSSTQDIINLMK